MATETQFIAKSHLAYTGTRTYIRGGDLYACFEIGIRQTQPDLAPNLIKRMRLVREVGADGEWVVTSSGLPDASATIEWLDGRAQQHMAAFIETGCTITQRRPDLPSMVASLTCDQAFAGQMLTKPLASAADFLNAIIEGNKALHQETLESRGEDHSSIRLIYIEDCPSITSGQLQLEFESIGVRASGDRRYSLCRVRSSAFSDDLKICYGF